MGVDLHYYGYRMYDPAIARFTGVDPIAEDFAHLSTYNYADNSPIANIDLHGLQAVKATDGKLLGYKVQAGQGPTQIAKDINDNHASSVNGKIAYTSIVYNNPDKFNNVIEGEGQVFDKNNPDFKSGNIQEGDYLDISNGFQDSGTIIEIDDQITKVDESLDSVEKVIARTELVEEDLIRQQKGMQGPGKMIDGGVGGIAGAAIWGTFNQNKKEAAIKTKNKLNSTKDSLNQEKKKREPNL